MLALCAGFAGFAGFVSSLAAPADMLIREVFFVFNRSAQKFSK